MSNLRPIDCGQDNDTEVADTFDDMAGIMDSRRDVIACAIVFAHRDGTHTRAFAGQQYKDLYEGLALLVHDMIIYKKEEGEEEFSI